MLVLNKSSIIFVLLVVTIKDKKACYKKITFGGNFCITCIGSFPDYRTSFQFELLKVVIFLNYQNYLYQNYFLASKFLDSKAKIV